MFFLLGLRWKDGIGDTVLGNIVEEILAVPSEQIRESERVIERNNIPSLLRVKRTAKNETF